MSHQYHKRSISNFQDLFNRINENRSYNQKERTSLTPSRNINNTDGSSNSQNKLGIGENLNKKFRENDGKLVLYDFENKAVWTNEKGLIQSER